MSSVLKYGSYSFPDSSVQFAWRRRAVIGPLGFRTHYDYQMQVRALYQGTSGTNLTSQLAALQSAMNLSDQDLVFKDDAGVDTFHKISSADTVNGIQVLGGPDTPMDTETGMRTEYLTKRTVQVLFGWQLPSAESEIVDFQQSIREANIGSADFVIQEALDGVPVQQFTNQASEQIFVQEGYCVGYSDHQGFPDLAYPSLYLKTRESYRLMQAPLRLGRHKSTHFRTEWRYVFRAPLGLTIAAPDYPDVTGV